MTSAECRVQAEAVVKQSGFTLIELSIVLVVIGLIVGGMLVGQDLYKAAKLRSGISQIQEYDTAVTVFKMKYSCLPGDCRSRIAGLGFASRSPSSGCGVSNQNRVYESRFFCGDSQRVFGDEFVLFWNDLLRAELIKDDKLDPTLNHTDFGCYNDPSCFPQSLLTDKYIYIYQRDSIAHYLMTNNTVSGVNTRPGLTPEQARVWDQKTDDGLPLSGRFQIVDDTNGGTLGDVGVPSPSATGCISASTTYNADSDYSDRVMCDALIRMGHN